MSSLLFRKRGGDCRFASYKAHTSSLHLVETKGLSPDAITVITFTKEAAENMRRRISNEENRDVFISTELRPRRILTMHSLGLEIARANHEKIGLPENFQVLTNSTLRRILFRDAAHLVGLTEAEAEVADKARQMSAALESGTPAAQVTASYERLLRLNAAIDYDDQINLACAILAGDPEVRRAYQEAAQQLLIDEYQDINPGQRALIGHLLGDDPGGLFCVGDDDQSIYSFRGGSPQYIRDFRRDLGEGARVLSLVQSRRCPDTVVMAGLNVVERFDPSRFVKPAPTYTDAKRNGPQIEVHNVASDEQEAEVVARVAKAALPKKSVLVLIPAKQYADHTKRALRHRRIAYDLAPSLDDSGFVLLEMVYDWTQHPTNNFALRLCIDALCDSGALDIPSRRSRTEEKKAARASAMRDIAELWSDVEKQRVSLWEALTSKAARGGLFADIHRRLAELQSVDAKHVGEFLEKVGNSLRPWANLDELVREVRTWLDELKGHQQGSEGGVRIMTLQAAKGLEAEVVCVLGLNDGIVPRQDASEHQVCESARLTYVSMTRAKEALHLFHARKRDGSITYLKESFQMKPSRFLEAIGAHFKKPVFHPAPSSTTGKRPKNPPRVRVAVHPST